MNPRYPELKAALFFVNGCLFAAAASPALPQWVRATCGIVGAGTQPLLSYIMKAPDFGGKDAGGEEAAKGDA